MAFQKYVRDRAGDNIVLRLSGEYGRLSPAAMQAIGNPRYVVLLWDDEGRAIGVQAAESSDPDRYSVSGGSMSMTGFLKRFGLPRYQESRRLSGVAQGQMLVFPLGGDK